MADSPTAVASIRRAAQYLRRDADLSESLGRAVMLNPAEVRSLADWLEFEARRLDETAGDPSADESGGMYALDLTRAYLHESGERS